MFERDASLALSDVKFITEGMSIAPHVKNIHVYILLYITVVIHVFIY